MKHDFEMRRFIFGLSAIVTCSPQQMPAIVAQRIPAIMRELAVISGKMEAERVKIVVDNEKHIEEEEARRKKGQDDDEDEDGDGFVDEDDEGENSDDSGADDEQAMLKKIEKFRKQGKTMDDDDGKDDYDDEDDSDYEYTGGDMTIYDSALDDVDELIHLKTALERLSAQDATYTQQVLSGLEPELQAKFTTCMQNAEALK